MTDYIGEKSIRGEDWKENIVLCESLTIEEEGPMTRQLFSGSERKGRREGGRKAGRILFQAGICQ